MRENQRSDPKFSFLNPNDPYHAYYRDKMLRVEQGEEEVGAAQTPTLGLDVPVVKEETKTQTLGVGRVVPLEPPPPEFIMDTPGVSAQEM